MEFYYHEEEKSINLFLVKNNKNKIFAISH